MRSDYIESALFYAILDELTYPNQLAMKVALKTGLRIDDVLSIKKKRLHLKIFVIEKKTGKYKRAYLGTDLLNELYAFAYKPPNLWNGSEYVFAHRTKKDHHRTRQAVYKDVKKAVAKLKLNGNVTPHSARKCAAVREYKKRGSVAAVQKFLNHDKEMTTIIYALSDCSELVEALSKR